jgi:hypothetical protein
LTSQHITKPLANFDLEGEGVVHVSILARRSAQFLFTPQDEKIKSGFSVVLGGWANATNSRSVLRYCSNLLVNNAYAGQCDDLVAMVIYDI